MNIIDISPGIRRVMRTGSLQAEACTRVRVQVSDRVHQSFWSQIPGHTSEQVRSQVSGQIRGQVCDQVYNQVWDEVKEALHE